MDATPGRPAPPEPNPEIDWLDVGGRRYSLDELHNVRIMHSAHSDLSTTAGLLGLTIIISIARLWDRLGTNGLVGALVIVAIPAALVLLGMSRERPRRVLVAELRGELLLIADDRDRRQFREAVRRMRRR